jgi:hypothetical protein
MIVMFETVNAMKMVTKIAVVAIGIITVTMAALSICAKPL